MFSVLLYKPFIYVQSVYSVKGTGLLLREVNTTQSMPEYGFSLNDIFPYSDRIYDSFRTLENTESRKPYSDKFYAVQK